MFNLLPAKLKHVLRPVYYALRHRGDRSRSYSIALPDSYGPRHIHVGIAVPDTPRQAELRFAEHLTDSSGNPTGTVLATMLGGFAVSHDLGESWRFVRVPGWQNHAFIHVYSLGDSEYLVQVKPAHLERNRNIPVDLLVVTDRGQVLETILAQGPRWHSCRAVHMVGDTLMYAEYPRNKGDENRTSSRVLRSCNRGRNWEVVFEQSAEQIRHFHFLQPRPGASGEWWLTSGDAAHQSRIWVTKDDGDSWKDITLNSALAIDGTNYPRSIFRLTDLLWDGPEVVWGTDDALVALGTEAGARVFRSQIGAQLAPTLVGRTKWPIRSMVDLGDFLLVLTQGSNQLTTPPEQSKPGVYLMPKRATGSGPGLMHLFDVENFLKTPGAGKGFTYSRASRAAVDGTFFTFRAPYQALPLPGQILKWTVSFT